MVAQPVGDTAFEDLTARARIRDAALRLFAERGMDATTVRDIAKAAGVSAGLLRHHYGSKEALRDACDAYALEQAMRLKEQAIVAGELSNPAFLPANHPTLLLLTRYFARSMMDGSPAAAKLFDRSVELTEEWFARHNPGQFTDPRAVATVLVAMSAGLYILHDHVSRALGADSLDTDGQLRTSRALIELYTTPLISPELATAANAAYDRFQTRDQEG